ncbi:SDR family oxidoreductase [Nocardia rhizosphaerihabitans]|uniref:3-ketoacyl-ACP reductase n=1 Tax=Nocardia rhizosphaerihabitans TaxID=1691570 RepID=A0ABQ2KQE6_9NOCA|nr:SDR family oxidoreductase [Nocardia rhizosphaerihabitans]GGN89004.1 3-ketoacyl-ACP reductase [Nocardia rhizosphaerihabitans]
MRDDLSGVALVTGAARGIGRACAVALAESGFSLVLVDIGADTPEVPYPLGSESQLEYTRDLCLESGANTEIVLGDVRSAADVDAAIEVAIQRFGRLDAVVNCAGIVRPSGRSVDLVSEDDWATMLDINLTGPFRVLSAAARVMKRQGSGSIVNIASTAGLVGYRNFAGYVASKHGLVGLTKAAALDLAPHGVRVNAVCPGSVHDDPELESIMLGEVAAALELAGDHEQTFVRDQPSNALVRAQDVAETVVWLASERSRSVVGSVVTVDGGFTSR